jgi:hypothetical protein
VSIASEADANLPNPAMNTSQLIDNFAAKGLNQQDMVVLSGTPLDLSISLCLEKRKRKRKPEICAATRLFSRRFSGCLQN